MALEPIQPMDMEGAIAPTAITSAFANIGDIYFFC
jgi:hypothetical protein